MNGDLIAYRQQTPVFREYRIPESMEDAIGIRQNGDDDDNNNVEDALQSTPAANEDDTMKMVVDIGIMPSGISYVLTRSNKDIQVFRGSDRNNPIFNSNSLETVLLTDGVYWVEWTAPTSSSVSKATLSLFPRAVNTGKDGPRFDDLSYQPFQTIVITWLGEFQTPADPPIHNGHYMGLMDWAIQRYQEGFDIYVYEEADGWIEPGLFPGYSVIANAINHHGIGDIALAGYSHGGGTVWEIANRLMTNSPTIINPFDIVFTGFVDAISQSGRWGLGVPGTLGSVNTRPPGSLFHHNQYQKNTNVWGLWLNGDNSGGDVDIDRSGLGVTHSTIDDHSEILASLELYFRQIVLP